MLVKPSKTACARLRKRLRDEMRALQGGNIGAVLKKMVPIVRGWAAYYRSVVSSEAFRPLDSYMFTLAYRWARRSHPNKSGLWIKHRYFGRFNKARQDMWVLGDHESGAYLPKFSWTGIVRHEIVFGTASPDDPSLSAYWHKRRRRKVPPPMDKTSLALAATQKGRCPLCKQALIAGAEYEPDSPREWIEWFAASKKMLNKHHFVYRQHGGANDRSNLHLVHADCHRQHHAGDGNRSDGETLTKPSRLA